MDTGPDKTPPIASVEFPPTHWSVVTNAANGSYEQRSQAMATLCQEYILPVKSFIARSVSLRSTNHTLEDLTQGFFLHVWNKRIFERFKRNENTRTKFRSFLMTCAWNYVITEISPPPGGRKEEIPFDEWIENQGDVDPAYTYTSDPSEEMQAEWARDWLKATVQWIRSELEKESTSLPHKEILNFVLREEPTSITDLAARVGLKESATKMRVFRIRKEIKRLLTHRIASTLTNPTQSDVDEEIAFLMRSTVNRSTAP